MGDDYRIGELVKSLAETLHRQLTGAQQSVRFLPFQAFPTWSLPAGRLRMLAVQSNLESMNPARLVRELVWEHQLDKGAIRYAHGTAIIRGSKYR